MHAPTPNPTRATVAEPRRLLGVWPHPDDEAYLSAGLMGRITDAGGHVTVLTLTRGTKGTSDPADYDQPHFGARRERELRASLAEVGVHDVRVGDFRDGECDLVPDEPAIGLVADTIAEVEPDTIVTFGPDGITGHPDHCVVSAWVTEAWRRTGGSELLYATMTDAHVARWAELHARISLFADRGAAGAASVPVDRLALAVELAGGEIDRKRLALGAPREPDRTPRRPHGRSHLPGLVAHRVLPAAVGRRSAQLRDRLRDARPWRDDMSTAAVTAHHPGWRHARQGCRDIVPMIIGVAPIAIAIGATISTSPVPALAGWAGGPLIVGGAAQLLTVQMLATGSAPFVIVVSAVLVNARVMGYAAAIAPWFREASLRQRLLVAIPLTDPLYFTATARFARDDLDQSGRLAYYLGAGGLLLASWMGIQAVAIAAGSTLPHWVGLHLAAPLALGGLLAKVATGRPATAAAVTAGAVAVAAVALPLQAGASLGVIAGIAAGVVITRRDTRTAGGETAEVAP